MNNHSDKIIVSFCKIEIKRGKTYTFLGLRMRCIYCKSQTYLLKNGYRKCKICKRKFSPKKVEREYLIIECFYRDLTILECSKKIKIHYTAVKRIYEQIRKKIALLLEEDYQNRKDILEFDEYIYLEKSKRRDKKNIFDGYNFLTFDYGGKIYNLMMPDLSRYKSSFVADGLEEIYYKEFEKFLKIHRISKLSSRYNLITKFWKYFESFIPKFKGINRENFFYYLKEAEFKFNYTQKEQKEILEKLFFPRK